MGALRLGDAALLALFCGEMGVKRIYLGERLVYERPGGYFYLELETEGE